MKKGLTELVFIMDRSGSMCNLVEDTIGGFNSLLAKQKKEEGEAIVSTVLFDDKVEVLHNRLDIREVEPITEREYFVRGCTALLDAIGGAITHISDVHKHLPDDKKPEKTLFIITTDGMENSSRKFDYKKVKKLVEKRTEKHGWEFLFLGANMDAISVADSFGIKANRAVTWKCDKLGAKLNYEVLSDTVSMARMAPSMKAMNQAFDAEYCFAEIQQDFKKRS